MVHLLMHYFENNEQIQLYASNCSFWVPFFLADKIALGQTLENFGELSRTFGNFQELSGTFKMSFNPVRFTSVVVVILGVCSANQNQNRFTHLEIDNRQTGKS